MSRSWWKWCSYYRGILQCEDEFPLPLERSPEEDDLLGLPAGISVPTQVPTDRKRRTPAFVHMLESKDWGPRASFPCVTNPSPMSDLSVAWLQILLLSSGVSNKLGGDFGDIAYMEVCLHWITPNQSFPCLALCPHQACTKCKIWFQK